MGLLLFISESTSATIFATIRSSCHTRGGSPSRCQLEFEVLVAGRFLGWKCSVQSSSKLSQSKFECPTPVNKVSQTMVFFTLFRPYREMSLFPSRTFYVLSLKLTQRKDRVLPTLILPSRPSSVTLLPIEFGILVRIPKSK